MKRVIVGMMVAMIAATMMSCGGRVFYDKTVTVDEHGWIPADSACFDVVVVDTTRLYDFLVEVRNNVDYPYANLFLFVATTFPDGSVARDTIECPMADNAGQWYGKHAGRYVDSRYRLRSGSARFPMAGTYHFAITNGMRDKAVVGVRNVGLRIENSKLNN